jgi:hypothetical protein
MSTTTSTRYSTFVASVKAARLTGECGACARLAQTGMPLQCNRCRTSNPDALTQYATLYRDAKLLGCDGDTLVNAVLDTLKAA